MEYGPTSIKLNLILQSELVREVTSAHATILFELWLEYWMLEMIAMCYFSYEIWI